jgi:predicted nuclease with TOPRIM domain
MRHSLIDAKTIKELRETNAELNKRLTVKAALVTAQRAEIGRLRREIARLQRNEGKVPRTPSKSAP